MHKRRALLVSIIVVFCLFNIMHGDARNLRSLADQYHNNTHQIADLDLNKTRLEQNTTDLNASVTLLEEQIRHSENNRTLLKSEIAALDKTIQEDSAKKNTTERNLRLVTVLSKKVPIMFLGTITGMIAGLWVVSVFLVFFWRK
jgi:septal ring factor EnvC (AmiA/AmiB activator)